MREFLTLSLFIFLFTVSLNAQKNYQDVVYLKNGGIVRGMIMEQIPNKQIKIQTADRSVWVYSFEEIEKITKEEIVEEKKEIADKPKFEIRKKGIASQTRAGVFVGREDTYFGGTSSIGYQFNSKYSLTIGTGIFASQDKFIPVFLMNRINILDSRITPTIGVELGYAFAKTTGYGSSEYHSIYVNPSFGLKVRMSKSMSWVFDLGYRYWNLLNSRYGGSYNMFSFQTGLEF